jgi:hypothetical protein
MKIPPLYLNAQRDIHNSTVLSLLVQYTVGNILVSKGVLGAVMVSVFATELKARGVKPGRQRWILMANKSQQHDILWMAKPSVPCRKASR